MVSEARFSGAYCTIAVSRPRPGVVLVVFEGRDIGDLGDAPLREIEKDLVIHDRIALFIDARRAKAASVDVSGQWAQWLRSKKQHFEVVNMLTGSRFIQLTADVVHKFAELGELMRLYTDAAAFDEELAARSNVSTMIR